MISTPSPIHVPSRAIRVISAGFKLPTAQLLAAHFIIEISETYFRYLKSHDVLLLNERYPLSLLSQHIDESYAYVYQHLLKSRSV